MGPLFGENGRIITFRENGGSRDYVNCIYPIFERILITLSVR